MAGKRTAARHFGLAVEDVALKTSDGLTLAGWYIPSRNRAAVIVLPANGRSGGLEHVRMLARHGYGVLIFDPRGTGGSEGDPTAGTARGTSMPPSPICSTARTSTPTASAASGSR